MKVHELKSLNFSEALSLLEEQMISSKKELDDVKSRAKEKAEALELSEKLAQQHQQAEAKMEELRQQQSYELSGRDHTIMTEVVETLDYISSEIQKKLHLL